jgi:lysozyme
MLGWQVTARDLIKKHEGLMLKKYICPAGAWSIGYGWNLDAWPLPPEIASYLRMNGRITEGMADYLLDISLQGAINDCRDLYPGFDGFTDSRKAALTDFVYNLGVTRAAGFKKMRKAIHDEDWDRAADEMYDSKWRKQVGKRATTLIGMVREG